MHVFIDVIVPLLQNRPLFQTICPGYLWTRDKRWLLSRVQWLAGPTWGTGAFCPGWSHQPGQKAPHLSRVVAPPGNTNRDKRVTLLSRLVLPPGIKGLGPFIPGGATNRDKWGAFCPGWWLHPGQKASVPHVGPASRWTRDKSHLLSRAQR